MSSLIEAITYRNWEAIPSYLHEIRIRNEDNATALHIACLQKAPIQTLKLLLMANSSAPSEKDNEGRTVLHYACSFASDPLPIVRLLLQENPSVTKIQDKFSQTPLHCACVYKKQSTNMLEVVELLLQANPQASYVKDKWNKTPLMNLSYHPEAEAACKLFLKKAPTCFTEEYCDNFRLLLLVEKIGDLPTKTQIIRLNPNAFNALDANTTVLDHFYRDWYFGIKTALSKAESISREEFLKLVITNRHGKKQAVEHVYALSSLILQVSSPSNTNLLSNAISNPKCPWSWCDFFLLLNPDQIFSHFLNKLNPQAKSVIYQNIFYCNYCSSRQLLIWKHGHCIYCAECAEKRNYVELTTNYYKDKEEMTDLVNFLFLVLKHNPSICRVAVDNLERMKNGQPIQIIETKNNKKEVKNGGFSSNINQPLAKKKKRKFFSKFCEVFAF